MVNKLSASIRFVIKTLTFLIAFASISSIRGQILAQRKVSICADDYKVSSYTLECQPGLGIEIKGAIEVFARQSSSVFPDCVASGFNYNYSKPFVDYCEGKGICTISSAFLDAEKMFDAEPYYLPDNSYYLKPFRIDIFYDCSSSALTPSTRFTPPPPVLTTSFFVPTEPTFDTGSTTTTTTFTITSTSTSTSTTTLVSTTTSTVTTTFPIYSTVNASPIGVTNEPQPSTRGNNTANLNTITNTNPITTTKVQIVGGNSATDRTVMIVLIVLGCIFLLIIIAIVVLICLRRRNQKRMDREFGYKAEKSTDNSANMNTIGGNSTLKEKSFVGPFTEMSNSTPIRNYENTSETHGTYRSRSNNGYDNTDNSMNQTSESPTGFSPLNRSAGANRPRIDHDEYWRTNI